MVDAEQPLFDSGARYTTKLDFSKFGLLWEECECEIGTDALGRPHTLIVTVPNQTEILKALLNDPSRMPSHLVEIKHPDGSTLTAHLLRCAGIGGDLLNALYYLGDVLWKSEVCSTDNQAWRFQLANLKLRTGDKQTQYGSGWALDRIELSLAGREWAVINEIQRCKGRADAAQEARIPLAAGRIETGWQEGDSRESVGAEANLIETILRFLLAEDVTWYVCERIVDGRPVEAYYPPKYVHYFRGGAWPINNNFLPGSFRLLFESIYNKAIDNREWFVRTLDLYSSAALSPQIEVRASIQNTLLDRIATHLAKEYRRPAFDEELDGHLDDGFLESLHNLIAGLSKRWSKEDTGGIIGSIKTRNRGDSFSAKVRHACGMLGLEPPPAKFLNKRHKLLHAGEFDGGDDEHILDYWSQIECLCVKMILRMVGYAGPFYHHSLGQHPTNLSDMLVKDGDGSD